MIASFNLTYLMVMETRAQIGNMPQVTDKFITEICQVYMLPWAVMEITI